MRGSPILHALILIIAWAALCFPIRYVTASREDVAETVEATRPDSRAWVQLRFSSVPQTFALMQGDTPLWSHAAQDGDEETQFERELPIALVDAGVDLWLTATLPPGQTAVEVRVHPDRMDAQAQTLWVDGVADEPVSFIWEPRDE